MVESALVGYPHEIKNALHAFVILKNDKNIDGIRAEINQLISKTPFGPIAKPEKFKLLMVYQKQEVVKS